MGLFLGSLLCSTGLFVWEFFFTSTILFPYWKAVALNDIHQNNFTFAGTGLKENSVKKTTVTKIMWIYPN
jgi:hypothetical protein